MENKRDTARDNRHPRPGCHDCRPGDGMGCERGRCPRRERRHDAVSLSVIVTAAGIPSHQSLHSGRRFVSSGIVFRRVGWKAAGDSKRTSVLVVCVSRRPSDVFPSRRRIAGQHTASNRTQRMYIVLKTDAIPADQYAYGWL